MKLENITVGMRVAAKRNWVTVSRGEIEKISQDWVCVRSDHSNEYGWFKSDALRRLVKKKKQTNCPEIPDSSKIGMIFHPISPGKFLMGDAKIKTEITKPFEMMSTPVTQWQWQQVMGDNPSHFVDNSERRGGNLPVESVSWVDVQEFIVRLNNLSSGDLIKKVVPDHKPGMTYRLLTEAEWEYVAHRAEKSTGMDLKLHAWYYENSDNATHTVGQKFPHIVDGSSFFDLLGNVWEWCSDWYGALSGGKDPKGPEAGSSRVVRGGSWAGDARYCRSAYRASYPQATATSMSAFAS